MSEVEEPGPEALHEAAENGVLLWMDWLLNQPGADADAPDRLGLSPLHRAAAAGFRAAVLLLLERGAELNRPGVCGLTPLHWAAWEAHADVVRTLLDRGADVHATDEEGATALHRAAEGPGLAYEASVANNWDDMHRAHEEQRRIVTLLLRRGADLHARDRCGLTARSWAERAHQWDVAQLLWRLVMGCQQQPEFPPHYNCRKLMSAARQGYPEQAQQLLENDVWPQVSNSHCRTPLFLAAENGFAPLVQLLLDHGAEPDQLDCFNCSPVCRAASKGHEPVVRLLLEHGAKLLTGSNFGGSALSAAAYGGHDSIIRFLVDHGLSLETGDNWCRTPLLLAARAGHTSAVRLLLDCGADLTKVDCYGRSAVHLATELDSWQLCGHLVLWGADLWCRQEHGLTPRQFAERHGHWHAAELLRRLEAGQQPEEALAVFEQDLLLVHAIASGNADELTELLTEELPPGREAINYALRRAVDMDKVDAVRTLLAHSPDIDLTDSMQLTCLHLLVARGSEETVRLFLDKGASPDRGSITGYTPLHLAAKYGHESIARLLLDNGANPNSADEDGYTALHVACEAGQESIVRLLLAHGADVARCLGDGRTSLHCAAKEGHRSLLPLLVEWGVAISAKNTSGRTARFLADRWGHRVSAELLRRLAGSEDVQATVAALEADLPLAEAAASGDVHSLLPHLDADPPPGPDALAFALLRAAENGQEDAVAVLLATGAPVTHTDGLGRTPLHWAAREGHWTVVELLVGWRADPEAIDGEGHIAQQLAERCGHLDAAELLRRLREPGCGTLLVVTLFKQDFPLGQAAASGYLQDLNQLLTTKPLPAPSALAHALRQAAAAGHEPAVRTLLNRGIPADPTEGLSTSPLHAAARFGHALVVRLLLDRGASVNRSDQFGCTALHIAARHRHSLVVQVLTERDADINVVNNKKHTPLHLAVKNDSKPTVALLLDLGADPNRIGESGGTALHDAARMFFSWISWMLADRGADPMVTDAEGRTAGEVMAAVGRRKGADFVLKLRQCMAEQPEEKKKSKPPFRERTPPILPLIKSIREQLRETRSEELSEEDEGSIGEEPRTDPSQHEDRNVARVISDTHTERQDYHRHGEDYQRELMGCRETWRQSRFESDARAELGTLYRTQQAERENRPQRRPEEKAKGHWMDWRRKGNDCVVQEELERNYGIESRKSQRISDKTESHQIDKRVLEKRHSKWGWTKVRDGAATEEKDVSRGEARESGNEQMETKATNNDWKLVSKVKGLRLSKMGGPPKASQRQQGAARPLGRFDALLCVNGE